MHRQIPVRPAVDPSYLSRGGVQAALAWLRLAVSSPERLAGPDVVLAARRPSRALSPKVVEWMSEQVGAAGLERLAGRLQSPRWRQDPRLRLRPADGAPVRLVGDDAAVLRAVRDDIGLDRAMELLESSRRRLDRSAQTDDLDALVALAALHPEPRGIRGLASPVAGPSGLARRRGAVHDPPGQGSRVAPRRAPRGVRRPPPPPPRRRRRGGAAGLPRRADTGLVVGSRRGGQPSVAVPRRAGRGMDRRSAAGSRTAAPFRASAEARAGLVQPLDLDEVGAARHGGARGGGRGRLGVRARRSTRTRSWRPTTKASWQ